MKLFQKSVSLLLVLTMLLSLVPATALASNEVVTTNEQGNYEIINEQGETTQVDESWEEDHPYGMLALGHHQVITEEGGATQILKVHRLGGTVGKASAIIQYAPAVVGTEDGGENPAYAVSPHRGGGSPSHHRISGMGRRPCARACPHRHFCPSGCG